MSCLRIPHQTTSGQPTSPTTSLLIGFWIYRYIGCSFVHSLVTFLFFFCTYQYYWYRRNELKVPYIDVLYIFPRLVFHPFLLSVSINYYLHTASLLSLYIFWHHLNLFTLPCYIYNFLYLPFEAFLFSFLLVVFLYRFFFFPSPPPSSWFPSVSHIASLSTVACALYGSSHLKQKLPSSSSTVSLSHSIRYFYWIDTCRSQIGLS